ncbi:type I glyceraldehyde-3-phosphate dehydrogenase [Helicobacter mustelae]|uniref:Glyceraldehyde-3-phosphate dehydrogenase n=1 Tax=Helicobacter mustelae (strain ATCC 43772 / CCUG 25715 / CIP 103759 / LMG 18044 / NCTC 12198 / R85-136P) TaxID=679897 RepID=D3UJE2_HELM1|nr:type I glyceraldehyde-3-phosphate dehydrogenase [Helicobacter mustelae]CBG40618.1 glyceraldehyde 3-phosphate dehydrogenase [Helicobacter mustelae 12198]SQH72116.1 glyceraldehyde 3-phosphate dehydrogenase [Helicobacter mustelae]STP13259.1 glyceraldehyde 3-phosphate dehydrogenase [Helicobacter mustelae]
MAEKIKIAINGFGRLGRSIARVICLQKDMELIAINDVGEWEILSYLLAHDSIHGPFPKSVNYEQNALSLDGKKIRITNHQDPKQIEFGDADIIIESSGKFLHTRDFVHHLEKGAKKVILSSPSNDDMPTFVLGANHQEYQGQSIISNASCTTNCLAPICDILERHFGIISANILTIHSYTNDQNLLDGVHRDKRRSRAAASNIIPTSTGAAKNLYKVLPSLKGKLHGHSVRVPVSDVSLLDLNLWLKQTPSIPELHALFLDYAKNSLQGILQLDFDFGVSSDFLHNPHSCIIANDLSFEVGGLLKIMAWYDNEWGYSNRIIELARYIHQR